MLQAPKKKRHAIVCSRNVVFNSPNKEEKNYYKDTDGNIYLEMFEKYDIEKILNYILDEHPDYEFITIQGETYGGTIQKRKYCDEHRFAIFNYIYKKKGEAPVRLNPVQMYDRIKRLLDLIESKNYLDLTDINKVNNFKKLIIKENKRLNKLDAIEVINKPDAMKHITLLYLSIKVNELFLNYLKLKLTKEELYKKLEYLNDALNDLEN